MRPWNDTRQLILKLRKKLDIYGLKLELERPMFIRVDFRDGIQLVRILMKTERCNSPLKWYAGDSP